MCARPGPVYPAAYSCFCRYSCWDPTENIARPNDSTGKRLTIPKLSAA